MSDGLFGVTPAVVPLAVIEVHEPEALRFEAERLDVLRPAVEDVAKRRGKGGVLGIFFLQTVQLRGQRLGAADRLRRHVLDVRKEIACLLQRKNRPGLAIHTADYNWRFPMRIVAGALSLVLVLAAGGATAQTLVKSQIPSPPPLRSEMVARFGEISPELAGSLLRQAEADNTQPAVSNDGDQIRPPEPAQVTFTQKVRDSRLGFGSWDLGVDTRRKDREPEHLASMEWPPKSSDGTFLIGGEVVGTIGSTDDTAFFNYTDYEHNALRMMRLAIAGQWRPLDRVALIAEVRSEDLSRVDTHAAYVRFRPWQSQAFDIQAGRIPPSFGAYGRRAYNADNPLIGYPLAYQYLTSLRADAIPNTVDDLLRMRGRGWQPSFPVGSTSTTTGLPLVSAFRWDTGVQGHWTGTYIEATAGVTAGTLSDPRFADNNGGRQVSGRVAAKPAIGLVVGASAAHGDWLSDDVVDLLPATARSRSYSQRAFGVDGEYSRAHWLVRAEVVWSGWQMPFMQLGTTRRLDARGMWLEGRYRFSPRMFVAARADRLDFSRVQGTVVGGGALLTWDAPVQRIEAGLGWYLMRNLVGRTIIQRNWRDGGRVHSRTFVSAQLAYWF